MKTRQALASKILARLRKADDPLLRDILDYLRSTTSVQEAGAIGGNEVKRIHGPEFYARIGSAGGKTTRQRYGTAHYVKIGSKGGRAVKNSRDTIE
jgi:general stress protein YciG